MNKLGQFAAACVAVLFAFGVCGSLFGATCTFNGSWDVTPSGESDEIVIESGSLAWGAALPAKVASWTQTDGTVTFETVYGETGFTLFEVTGDVSLTGGKWTHKANSTTEAYRLAVSVGGNFTIGEDAAIDVTACGYSKAGPSYIKDHCGGAYGGQGTGFGSKPVTLCYGSITKPVNIGSSGHDGKRGGGGVCLTVAGTLTVNGRIFADGQSSNPVGDYYACAGGSIWVTASAIAGAGEVSASASRIKINYFGGGGRISFILTGEESDFSEFACKVYAYPSRNASDVVLAGAAGTVYYETKADGEGQGRLVIDRGATDGTLAADAATDIVLDDQDASFNPSEIVLANGATMKVTSGSRKELTVGKSLTLDGKNKVVLSENAVLDLTTAEIVHPGTGEALLQFFNSTLRAPDDGLTVSEMLKVQVHSSGTIDAKAVTVESGGTMVIDTPLTVTGDLIVEDGGVVTHTVNTKDTDYRMTLNVGGDLTVRSGGAITARAKGYPKKVGPGSNLVDWDAGCHGGRGHSSAETPAGGTGVCYGSITKPVDLGSGNGSWGLNGGGAVRIAVAGALTNDGCIDANGQSTVKQSLAGYDATPAGSVWITCATLAGAGRIEANAYGDDGLSTIVKNSYPGGGRIAVWLTQAGATFDDYTGVTVAYGGRGSQNKAAGGAGTVYLKTGDQSETEGTLIIDNQTPAGYSCQPTEIGPNVTDAAVGDVIVRSAVLKVLAGQRLTVRGDWDVPVNAFASEPGAALVFAGTDTCHVLNDLTVSDFICQTPGKEIVFGDGTTLTIAAGGRFQVEGDDEQDVTLRSETAKSPWDLVVDESAAQSVNRVSVADCNASGGAQISAVNSTLLRTENWKNTTVIVGQTVTWTGAAGSSAWLAAGNWDAERAPLATDRLVIAPGAVQPVLSDDFTAMDLTVEEGATFDLNGKSFRTTGDLTVAGTVKTARGGKFVANGAADFTGATVDTLWLALELAGDGKAVQNFAADGLAFDSVTVVPNAAGVTVADTFTVRRLACEADAAFALSFAPGITVSVEELLTLEGPIALASTAAGQTWNFAVTGVKGVSGGVTVSDCTADILTPPAVWTGAVSDDFNTPGNWSTGEVPDESDDVIIGAGTVRASAAIAVASLWLKDGANVAIDKGAAVARTVYLSSGATLTHSANGNAGGNSLVVDIGGNLAVEEKAAIDVSYKGYPSGRGPDWASGTAGGTYAGRGIATDNAQVEGKTYGSILWPTDLGAGGNSYPGGGAVILTVAGVSRVDGEIKATGRGSYSGTSVGYEWYTGSGGSVSFKTAALVGMGDIGADGGDYVNDYAGSGGRVAVILTGAGETFDEFGDSFHAYAGLNASVTPAVEYGSPGTIYLETATDGAGKGRVLIRNLPDAKVGGHNKPMLDYPVLKRTPSPKEAKDATFVLENLFDINLVADAVMGDLYIKGTKPKIYLNGHTLRIRTDRHNIFDEDEEARWAAQIIPGEDAEGNPGKIIWKQGLLLLVK